MKKSVIFALVILIALVLIAVISTWLNPKTKNQISSPGNNEQELINACINACQDALKNGINLEEGPCLLDPIQNSEWVCDIAHNPRQAVDNNAKNQCPAFRSGIAKHFIEVTPDCKLIRKG